MRETERWRCGRRRVAPPTALGTLRAPVHVGTRSAGVCPLARRSDLSPAHTRERGGAHAHPVRRSDARAQGPSGAWAMATPKSARLAPSQMDSAMPMRIARARGRRGAQGRARTEWQAMSCSDVARDPAPLLPQCHRPAILRAPARAASTAQKGALRQRASARARLGHGTLVLSHNDGDGTAPVLAPRRLARRVCSCTRHDPRESERSKAAEMSKISREVPECFFTAPQKTQLWYASHQPTSTV